MLNLNFEGDELDLGLKNPSGAPPKLRLPPGIRGYIIRPY